MSQDEDKVVRLLDCARGHAAVGGQEELDNWLREWAAYIGSGKEGQIRTVAIVFEREDGTIAKVSQSIARVDTNTIIGFLTRAIVAVAHGEAGLNSTE